MAIFFIADTHFDDKNILRCENRPFDSVDSMNTTIISNWNRVVKKTDEVYVLGDVGTTTFIKSLNGKKYLVKGNHDVKSNAFYRRIGFEEVYDCPIIIEGFWILSHEALYINKYMPYANLFGHVHNSPIVRDYSSHHFCVSVERILYTPISFNYIKKKVR